MSQRPPAEPRRFVTPDGLQWEVRILPSGRPSPYLAPTLDRPIAEFRRLSPPGGPRTYAALAVPDLATLGDAELLATWRRSRAY